MCATPVECENIGFDSIFQVVGAVGSFPNNVAPFLEECGAGDADNIPYTPWSRA